MSLKHKKAMAEIDRPNSSFSLNIDTTRWSPNWLQTKFWALSFMSDLSTVVDKLFTFKEIILPPVLVNYLNSHAT